MKFKIIQDLTSDEYYEAYGKDLKEVFENSALALFSIMCKIDQVEPRHADIIDVKGKNAEDLLYSWLSALVSQVDAEEKFYSKFDILEISEHQVKARIFGEPISPKTGVLGVKAITNYKFGLRKTSQGYVASVAVDV